MDVCYDGLVSSRVHGILIGYQRKEQDPNTLLRSLLGVLPVYHIKKLAEKDIDVVAYIQNALPESRWGAIKAYQRILHLDDYNELFKVYGRSTGALEVYDWPLAVVQARLKDDPLDTIDNTHWANPHASGKTDTPYTFRALTSMRKYMIHEDPWYLRVVPRIELDMLVRELVRRNVISVTARGVIVPVKMKSRVRIGAANCRNFVPIHPSFSVLLAKPHVNSCLCERVKVTLVTQLPPENDETFFINTAVSFESKVWVSRKHAVRTVVFTFRFKQHYDMANALPSFIDDRYTRIQVSVASLAASIAPQSPPIQFLCAILS